MAVNKLNESESSNKYHKYGNWRVRFDAEGSLKVYRYIDELLKELGVTVLNNDYTDPKQSLKDQEDAPVFPSSNAYYEVWVDGDSQFIEIYGWTTPDVDGFNDKFGLSSDGNLGDIHPEFVDRVNKFISGMNDWELINESASRKINEELDPSEIDIVDPTEDKRLVTVSFDVYVSYDESDEEIEDNIVEGLRNVGYEVDTTVNIGTDLSDTDDEIITTEAYDSDLDTEWEEIDSKSVTDSDGFITDYTLYFNGTTYIAMFGDKELYEPDIDFADFETESEDEAREWFDSYEGFTDEDESVEITEDNIVSENYGVFDKDDEELFSGSLDQVINYVKKNKNATDIVLFNDEDEAIDEYSRDGFLRTFDDSDISEDDIVTEELDEEVHPALKGLVSQITKIVEKNSAEVLSVRPKLGQSNIVFKLQVPEDEEALDDIFMEVDSLEDVEDSDCEVNDFTGEVFMIVTYSGIFDESLKEDYDDDFNDEELSNIYGGDRSICPECGSSNYHDGRCYKCDPVTDDEIEEV